MARKRAKQLSWSASRRNAFIEFRVFWHGRINRADLMDTFGISLQQASLDLTRYSERWKRNLVYDKSQRAYVRGKAFKPRFGAPDCRRKDRPDVLLHQVRYDRAVLYFESGQRVRTRSEFERIHAADPGFEGVAERLGVCG